MGAGLGGRARWAAAAGTALTAALLLPGPWWLGLGLVVAGLVLSRHRVRHRILWHWRWRRAYRLVGLNIVSRAPRLVATRPVAVGDELVLELPLGTVIDELVVKAARLAHALHVRTVRVEPVQESASRVRVTVIRWDPLAEPLAPPWPLSTAPDISLRSRLPVAVDRNAEPVELEVRDHLLLEGAAEDTFGPLSLVLARAAMDPQVELRLFDGPDVSLTAWHDLSAQYAAVALDPARARELLLGMRDELRRRHREAMQRSSLWWEPEHGSPLILLVVHELRAHLSAEESNEVVDLLQELVRGGARMGIMLLITGTDVPAGLRAAMPVRWECEGHRVTRLVRRGRPSTPVRCYGLSEQALVALLDRARLHRAAWSDLSATPHLPAHGWHVA